MTSGQSKMEEPTDEGNRGLKRVKDFSKFEKNMRTLRNLKQWTLKDAAKLALLKPNSRWEQLEYGRGYPSLQEIMSICEILEVTIDDMLNKECVVTIEFK